MSLFVSTFCVLVVCLRFIKSGFIFGQDTFEMTKRALLGCDSFLNKAEKGFSLLA